MSSICGYWTLNSRTSAIESMNSRLNYWNADKIGQWVDKPVALGHLMLYNTPESLSETLPYFDAETRLCITADARIDNREELTQKLEELAKKANVAKKTIHYYRHLNLDQTFL